MSIKTVPEIIQQLKETSSTNEKIEILKEHKENYDLQQVFVAALSPYHSFYAKGLPDVEKSTEEHSFDGILCAIMEVVEDSLTREETKDTLEFISGYTNDDWGFWDSVVAKDLGCGVSATTVNKVWPKLIPQFKPMKGEEAAHLRKLSLPVCVQDKMDGTRCIIRCDGEEVTVYSSSGKVYPNLAALKETIRDNRGREPFLLDGELVFSDEGGDILPRETSNGLANKSLNGNNPKEIEDRAVFYAFDMMDLDALDSGDDTPYSLRYDDLELHFFGGASNVRVLDFYTYHSWEEVDDHFKKAVAEGKEGIMVKSMDHPYEPKRSKHWVKLKKEFELDLVITGWEPHKKKEGWVGALTVESSDGVVKGNVGTGLDDNLRQTLFNDAQNGKLEGRICTVRIHDLTKKKDQWNFYLPRLIEFRDDKEEADSFQKIMEMVRPNETQV